MILHLRGEPLTIVSLSLCRRCAVLLAQGGRLAIAGLMLYYGSRVAAVSRALPG